MVAASELSFHNPDTEVYGVCRFSRLGLVFVSKRVAWIFWVRRLGIVLAPFVLWALCGTLFVREIELHVNRFLFLALGYLAEDYIRGLFSSLGLSQHLLGS